jgi:hypothetical protein
MEWFGEVDYFGQVVNHDRSIAEFLEGDGQPAACLESKRVQLESATYCAVRYPYMSSVRVQADAPFATLSITVPGENKIPDGYT